MAFIAGTSATDVEHSGDECPMNQRAAAGIGFAQLAVMRLNKSALVVVVLLFVRAGFAAAQGTTGTIEGRAVDGQGLPVPGVAVTASGPQKFTIELALTTGRCHPDMAIMLMTGYADQRERSHGLDALVHDVIGKPFTLEQIQGAVREALVARH